MSAAAPSPPDPPPAALDGARNVADLRAAALAVLAPDVRDYLEDGAEDGVTLRANAAAFGRVALRPRRLVDVSRIDTSLSLCGERLASPILLAPVGYQGVFHPDGECGAARAAAARGHRMICSTVSNASVGAIAEAAGEPVWFQLYPTTSRRITAALLARAEDAGCPVVALTVDVPVFGNREAGGATLARLIATSPQGNLDGLTDGEAAIDASLTWDVVGWLRERTSMKVVLKGIVTAEDARLAVEHGADGLVVSNHGGRQLDGGRATLDCLPEVVAAVDGRMPVLLDGGVRRGTDVLKALALGADAVCVGRPFIYGLAAGGRAGVERALEILQTELERAMRLCGTPRLADVGPGLVAR